MQNSVLHGIGPKQDISLPQTYWGVLSSDDRSEFFNLRSNFLQSQKTSSKDKRSITFRKELVTVLKFIERSESHKEERSILAGVCFAGPFVCVNTRQFKGFLGRCKSSINGNFQQMGYVALRTKSKASACIASVLPKLVNDRDILRQWTVRYAGNSSLFCFVSSFSHADMPTILESDFIDEKQSNPQINPIHSSQHFSSLNTLQKSYFTTQQNLPKPMPPNKPSMLDFDLPDVEDFEKIETNSHYHGDMTPSFSYSLDCFPSYGQDNWDLLGSGCGQSSFEWDHPLSNFTNQMSSHKMTHSGSQMIPKIDSLDFDEDA